MDSGKGREVSLPAIGKRKLDEMKGKVYIEQLKFTCTAKPKPELGLALLSNIKNLKLQAYQAVLYQAQLF